MGVPVTCQTARAVPTRTLAIDGPYDLQRTLGPLARGRSDPTLALSSATAWLALRTTAGPVTIHARRDGDRLEIEAWGEGAVWALGRAARIFGLEVGTLSAANLRDASHPVIAGLARRLPGIRIPSTGAVLDALLPAILEQKVTGTEARRAWLGLLRAHGAPAPMPRPVGWAGDRALRLRPEAATLARLPTYAYHRFGVEGRRAETIRRAAARADWLEEVVDLPAADAQARLRSVPGIGPWTAAEVAARALGDPDAVSVGDFHLPDLVSWALAREPRASDERMLELLAPYAGRRALVIRLLESSGLRPPRYGPRLAPRRIEDL